MSKILIWETGLMVSGATLGAAGAALLNPLVIGAGVFATGTAAVLRYRELKARQIVA